MITTNEQKKLLVHQLLDSKSITIEQAYMLLDEQAPPVVTYPDYIPWWERHKVYVGTPNYGAAGTISYSTAGTSSLTVENITTDTVRYSQEQWDNMLRSGQISYTSAQC